MRFSDYFLNSIEAYLPCENKGMLVLIFNAFAAILQW